MKSLFIFCTGFLILSCAKETKKSSEWHFEKTISLSDINPIGIAVEDDNVLILSDGDHNRIVKVDTLGNMVSEISNFQRPMHIDFGLSIDSISSKASKKAIFVPEYGRDSIAVVYKMQRNYLAIPDSLDAPAAVSVWKNEIAIADFYANRILYFNGKKWNSFGKKGTEPGEFNYPTDVQITEDRILVADAYNNRGQVFNKTGEVITTFGQDLELNASVGIFKEKDEILLTDFENNRIFIFNKDYQLHQELSQGIKKPTDAVANKNKLYITNYASGELVVYSR